MFDGSFSYDPDGDGVIFSWNFGDGTPLSADPMPTHTFAAAGTYTVTLTVTDDFNLSSQPVTKSVPRKF